ncbi:spore coat U domain-containing protein [Klebsiella oxytoca]|uniref:Fimbrial major subunit CsuA/B family protein n=1 Tax=Klebsiella oxytoca TaxID=571 RepID=A0A6B8MLV9_KLEOX|nr:spore coat U domain-containing protein [Klebsiella oxytoca]QGN38665.1 fimbrial major subunit CsuA/B family protein [Klebsiella oxytoca]
MLRPEWLTLFLLFASGAQAATVQKTFKVSAQITAGCALGAGDGSQTTDFGTLSFGTLSSLYNNVDVASTSGAGSIIVTCTPGTSISIALDYGVNGGSATQRFMSSAGKTLAYQLYQDANRSTVWGNNTQALSVASFPSTTQTYTVYGRLFATNGFPAVGSYTDTVTVTLTY